MRPGLALVLAAALAPPAAGAWNQATTESGLPLHWEESCVYFTLADVGSDDVPDIEALHAAVREGFLAWNVDCSALTVIDGGLSECSRARYRSGNKQANLVVWIEEDWPFAHDEGDPYAVTSVHYERDTGAILDADVEFNGVDFTWGTTGDPEVSDVWNTMAHEAGHVLGLDHSSTLDATMYPYALVGETYKRDLWRDDVDGICAIYPLEVELEPCPDPPGPAALCMIDGSGCSCAVLASRDPSCALVIGLVALLAVAHSLASGRRASRPRRSR